jgi:cytochrome P450
MMNLTYLIVFFALFSVARIIIRDYLLHQFSSVNNCEKPQRHHPYDIFGLCMPLSMARNFRARNALLWTKSLFNKYRGTFISRIAGNDYVFTTHPQNVKALLSSQFTDFSASAERAHLLKHFSSRGILTLDGNDWAIAREQLRKQFARHRSMVDLDMHERHIQSLISQIPCNESTVDLQDWFSKQQLDTLTEFVLGQSASSLSKGQTREQKEFENSLRYIKKIIASKGFAGPFHHLIGGREFVEACETVRAYVEKSIIQHLKDTKNLSNGDQTSYCLLKCLAAEEENFEVLRDQRT